MRGTERKKGVLPSLGCEDADSVRLSVRMSPALSCSKSNDVSLSSEALKEKKKEKKEGNNVCVYTLILQ